MYICIAKDDNRKKERQIQLRALAKGPALGEACAASCAREREGCKGARGVVGVRREDGGRKGARLD